jgi:ribonuclease R
MKGTLIVVRLYSKSDPFWEREKEKYENPIPSREFIGQYLDEQSVSVTLRHLLQAFGLETDEEKEALRRRLRAMERDGQIISNRRGQYALVNKLELIRGRVVGKKEGYGFLIPDDGSDDLYLSPVQMRTVFPNDVVLVRISGVDVRGRREGSIIEILERSTQQVVGYFQEEGGIYYVEPEKKDTQQNIIIPSNERHGAVVGQIVIAAIISQPTLRHQASGKIIEILGDHMAPGLEIEVAIRSYQLPYHWPDAVQAEISQIVEEIPKEEIKRRQDWRKLPFVTIDSEDAQDFDDAVYCERNERGWRLYVAIADVSHYVQPMTLLDKEALNRGNSVYFPNRVLPMLPELLSNGICSLKPDVDRLCIGCAIQTNEQGRFLYAKFYETIIKSKARLTYTEVSEMLKGKKTTIFRKIATHLRNLHQFYKVLHQQRIKRGALDFDNIETRIIFGKNHKIEQIVPVERNDAMRIIEECMLLANVAAAKFLQQNNMPFLYRVHKGPDPDQLENIRLYLQSFDLKLGGKNNPSPLDYSKLLKEIRDRSNVNFIQTILLRSLKQAVYSPVNEGHFGLAYDSYCHFTSPIRRYPDLLVHRSIRHFLRNKSTENFLYDDVQLSSYANKCSMTERRADEAVRDAIDWLKCEYMLDKLGREFEGVISDVTGFGIFVELKDIYVQGLVHITALKNDYYHFDPIRRYLFGKKSGISYRLGGEVQVKVARVDLDHKKIDFTLKEYKYKFESTQKSKKTKKSKKARKKKKASTKAKAT